MIYPLLLMLGLACSDAKHPIITLDVGGHAVSAELATDEAERSQGLMFRKSLPKDAGMLFTYPDEAPRAFWMKNTPLPLSIAYIDRSGKIVRIVDLKPHDTTSVPSLYPVMYALEMSQGWFDEHGVKKGDKITGIPKDLYEK